MMKAANLCLLSSSPTKGQESHLPLILSPLTVMCISGNLHLGQQTYFSMNLSNTFLRSSSVNSPLMMQLVLFLPPASLNVVWEAFSKPNHLRIYCSLVLRCLATSPRLTIFVLIPFPLLSIFSCILGILQRNLGSTTVDGMFNIGKQNYKRNIKLKIGLEYFKRSRDIFPKAKNMALYQYYQILASQFKSTSLMTKKIESLKQIASKYSYFFFDLDGVIWKGSQKVKGGVEALQYLRQNNKRLFFITNSSIRSKQMLKERFEQFGFNANLDEIYPSDYITRLYISSRYADINKWLVIGKTSLYEEIKMIGKQVIHIDSWDLEGMADIEQLTKKFDRSIEGVVMGYDSNLTYRKIVTISLIVQNGAKFIGTNPDKYTMVGGYKVPGCGSMIKTIEEATQIKAEIAGKPNPFILRFLIESEKLNPNQCLMIGDNLETDITFSKNGGIDGLCVLTGVATEKMVLDSGIATYYSEYLL